MQCQCKERTDFFFWLLVFEGANYIDRGGDRVSYSSVNSRGEGMRENNSSGV